MYNNTAAAAAAATVATDRSVDQLFNPTDDEGMTAMVVTKGVPLGSTPGIRYAISKRLRGKPKAKGDGADDIHRRRVRGHYRHLSF